MVVIIDNKGKLFGKINIIDICVILVVILAVVVTYFKFNVSTHSDVTEYKTEITYVIEAKNLRSFTTDAIEVGETLYDFSNDKVAGVVVDKKVTPATEFITCANGDIVRAELPERYNLELTVVSPGLVKDGMAVVESGKSIHLNQNTTYYTRRIQSEFETMDIKIKEQ